MIVKNEGKVIQRAIDSVLSIIDYWVIFDTGSTDNTPAVILQSLHGIPGELHRTDWVNFGHNRTEAVQLARNKADYLLVMDADMVANIYADFKSDLMADSYQVKYEGETEYYQPMLLSSAHDWHYVGVTHEYIHSDTASSSPIMDQLTLTHFSDGGMRSDKFERDIKLLTKELEKDDRNVRNMFYLAQSYKDIDAYNEALHWYQLRAECEDGWDEERWYAQYQCGNMMFALEFKWQDTLESYLAAYALRPSRLEPLYKIVSRYRQEEEYALGYIYSSQVYPDITYPSDLLFIEKPVYKYLLLLEHGVCAYALGRISESIHSFNKVIDVSDLPDSVHESALRGINRCLEYLYQPFANAATCENKVNVVIPFYNPGKFFQKCIDSVLNQDYDNYEVTFINDGSTDGSDQLIPKNHPKVHYIQHVKREGLGYSLHTFYTEWCQPDSIVVNLDADDWLSDASVLDSINTFYNLNDCWVMYGQFQYSDGSYGISRPFASEQDFSRLRENWVTSHIRTFRAGLYHRIRDQDLDYRCMKNDNGEWYESAVDAAIMYPICELAGFEKVKYNSQVLYTYNVANPHSISNSNRANQAECYEEITRKPRFRKIQTYLSINAKDI